MFSAHRSTKRYCSANCRLHAYRQRVPSIADIRNRLDRELERAHRGASLSRWRSGFVFIPSATLVTEKAFMVPARTSGSMSGEPKNRSI